MQLRSRVAAAILLAGTAGLIGPAIGQNAPQNLLPEGFGAPSAPAPAPSAPATPRPALPSATLPASPPPGGAEPPAAGAPVAAAPAVLPPPLPVELPETSRRDVDMIGPLGPGTAGLGADAFGRANGRLLSDLMRRTNAPIASRWASILLRRALLTEVPTPSYVPPVDWVAERAWLLLRMGEADAARMLVQAVDVERYTPKMLAVAEQVALATADPVGLCPLTEAADAYSKERSWPLVKAMCAALSGEGATASALIDRARAGRGGIKGIDALLAEKVVGAGVNGRRAVSIEWTGVDRLTSWRYGLAAATNVAIPSELLQAAAPQVTAWAARAPFTPLADRVPAALAAATMGVYSNATLVDLYGALVDQTDPADLNDSKPGKLRLAYAGEDQDARLSALRSIWDDAADPRARYASLILTARAAARIAPSTSLKSDATRIVGALMSAGFDIRAARWGGVVDGMSSGDDAWSILAVGTPRPAVDLSASRVRDFIKDAGDDKRAKAQLLVAALAGLDRLNQADAAAISGELGFSLAREDAWTRMMAQAVRDRQPGTAALLVAIAMQTHEWKAVSPRHFYRMIAGLRALGLDAEARMIAAEAMTRL